MAKTRAKEQNERMMCRYIPKNSVAGETVYTCLLVADFVHELKPLQWLFHHHANVLLCQWAGAVRVVKVKQALVGVDS